MSVREMGAGEEMDRLVATRVMELDDRPWGEDTRCAYCGHEMRWCGERSRCSTCVEWRYSPYREYSTDIAAAWEVVEKMREREMYMSIEPAHDDATDKWLVEVWVADPPTHGYTCTASAYAPTAPLAICRAALLAVGVE